MIFAAKLSNYQDMNMLILNRLMMSYKTEKTNGIGLFEKIRLGISLCHMTIFIHFWEFLPVLI